MMELNVNNTVSLKLSEAAHAKKLFSVIDNNRLHLSAFLPWVPNMKKTSDVKRYLQNCERLNLEGVDNSYNIFENKELVGRVGLSFINNANKTANIGYWLAADAQGKGIMIESVKTLIAFGFNELKLNRLEIKAATHNKKSRQIPEALGFQYEGTLRQAEIVNQQYFDLAMYALLHEDWKQK